MTELSENARIARNKYHKNWRNRNKEKIKEYNIRYWENKAGTDNVTDNVTDKMKANLNKYNTKTTLK